MKSMKSQPSLNRAMAQGHLSAVLLLLGLLLPAFFARGDAWTETKKTMYLLRVDFADLAGEPISQAEIVTRVNGGVSNQIYQMSYGKTWVEAAATPMVVRLPHGTNYYRTNADWFQIHTDAVAAFNALNTGVNVSNYDV